MKLNLRNLFRLRAIAPAADVVIDRLDQIEGWFPVTITKWNITVQTTKTNAIKIPVVKGNMPENYNFLERPLIPSVDAYPMQGTHGESRHLRDVFKLNDRISAEVKFLKLLDPSNCVMSKRIMAAGVGASYEVWANVWVRLLNHNRRNHADIVLMYFHGTI